VRERVVGIDEVDSAMERDYSVNTEELSALIDRQEELESELNTLRDQIDELRRKPSAASEPRSTRPRRGLRPALDRADRWPLLDPEAVHEFYYVRRGRGDRTLRRMVDRLTNQVEKEERDQQILRAVIEHGPIGIVRLSDETGIPEHKVRYSLRMLEDDELIEPTPDGAVPADDIGERLDGRNAGLDGIIDRLEELKDLF
jgi:predicted transcriptional regulator